METIFSKIREERYQEVESFLRMGEFAQFFQHTRRAIVQAPFMFITDSEETKQAMERFSKTNNLPKLMDSVISSLLQYGDAFVAAYILTDTNTFIAIKVDADRIDIVYRDDKVRYKINYPNCSRLLKQDLIHISNVLTDDYFPYGEPLVDASSISQIACRGVEHWRTILCNAMLEIGRRYLKCVGLNENKLRYVTNVLPTDDKPSMGIDIRFRNDVDDVSYFKNKLFAPLNIKQHFPEDFWFPIRPENANVETLPGAQNIAKTIYRTAGGNLVVMGDNDRRVFYVDVPECDAEQFLKRVENNLKNSSYNI